MALQRERGSEPERGARTRTERVRAPRSCFGAPHDEAFFARETEIVARELLGAVLVCETEEGLAAGRVVETEAYLGEHDEACHAVVGETRRTQWLYGPPGIAYVYFIYGAHWCFNAVTREAGHPSAVLVRAVEPVAGIELMRERRRHPRHDRDLTSGPGKLCAALGISGAHNGARLYRASSALTVRCGIEVDDGDVIVTPRIGITRAADRPLRWFVKGNPYVSRTPSHFIQRTLSP